MHVGGMNIFFKVVGVHIYRDNNGDNGQRSNKERYDKIYIEYERDTFRIMHSKM